MNEGNWNNNDDNSFSGSLDPTSVNSQQNTYQGDAQNASGQEGYGGAQQETQEDAGPHGSLTLLFNILSQKSFI